MSDWRILIVDDEKTTRLALREAFRQKGYTAEAAASGAEALRCLETAAYDVVILDLQMPGMRGEKVLAQAEALSPDTAFIVLTAHATTDSAVTALRSGAFDYLYKPASLETLFTAVTRAIQKKEEATRQKRALQLLEEAANLLSRPARPPEKETILRAAGLSLDLRRQTAVYHNRPLRLTPVEYRLLRALVENADATLSYAELARLAQRVDVPEDQAKAMLRTHIYRLRQKLTRRGECPLHTVWGRGVILSATPPETA